MLRRLTGLAFGATVLAGALAAGPAQALPTYTQGSASIVATTSTNTSVLTTTAFILTSIVNGNSDTGSLLGAPGLPHTFVTPLTIDFSNPSSFMFNIAGIGEFDPTTIQVLAHTPFPFASVTYAVIGTFTIGSDFANAGSVISADETWTLNQTGSPGQSISVGGTFDAPETILAPEPTTLMLVGGGLLALAARRRKRTSEQ